jgi:hypothetical protein
MSAKTAAELLQTLADVQAETNESTERHGSRASIELASIGATLKSIDKRLRYIARILVWTLILGPIVGPFIWNFGNHAVEIVIAHFRGS